MISQYMRDRKGRKMGALVAILDANGNIVIGHSKWNKKRDGYDQDRCLQVAKDRAAKDSKQPPALSLFRHYRKFMDRAKRYFKRTRLSENTVEALNTATVLREKARAATAENQANV